MAVTIFAAAVAFWMTGMIPLAAAETCLQPDPEITWAVRLAVYWGWPLWFAIIVWQHGRLPLCFAPWSDR